MKILIQENEGSPWQLIDCERASVTMSRDTYDMPMQLDDNMYPVRLAGRLQLHLEAIVQQMTYIEPTAVDIKHVTEALKMVHGELVKVPTTVLDMVVLENDDEDND